MLDDIEWWLSSAKDAAAPSHNDEGLFLPNPIELPYAIAAMGGAALLRWVGRHCCDGWGALTGTAVSWGSKDGSSMLCYRDW